MTSTSKSILAAFSQGKLPNANWPFAEPTLPEEAGSSEWPAPPCLRSASSFFRAWTPSASRSAYSHMHLDEKTFFSTGKIIETLRGKLMAWEIFVREALSEPKQTMTLLGYGHHRLCLLPKKKRHKETPKTPMLLSRPWRKIKLINNWLSFPSEGSGGTSNRPGHCPSWSHREG